MDLACSRNLLSFQRPMCRRIIAVACPQCAKMLEDAVKSEELEDRLKVMDVAEIASGCLM